MIERFPITLLISMLMIVLFPNKPWAQQNEQFQLTGQVVDAKSNAALPFAHIMLYPLQKGLIADDDGRFNVLLRSGNYRIMAAHVGYSNYSDSVFMDKNLHLEIRLVPKATTLKELVVKSEKGPAQARIDNTQMGITSIKKKEMMLLPSLGGEPDVIKTFQLLPGTTKGVEGSTDFFVRGGDADQNLVMIDGATVYNTGHLLGFMSVFNPDVIEEVTIVKGAFPAKYGGRLSSILDIQSDASQVDKTEITGSIGVIATRLGAKIPLVKKKLSLKLAGRRTYIDRILALTDNPDFQLPYYFYDYNGSLNYRINADQELNFSLYGGNDILDFSRTNSDNTNNFQSDFDLYSSAYSLEWVTKKNNSERTIGLYKTKYNYSISNAVVDEDGETDKVLLTSSIEDITLRWKNSKPLNNKTTLGFGAESTMHSISPAALETTGFVSSILPSARSEGISATEWALYAAIAYEWNADLLLDVGYRQSGSFSSNTNYFVPEPRVSARYLINPNSSFKFSYSRNGQYMHRVSSSSISLPIDIWYTVNDNIKPQSANQLSIGYYQYFPKKDWRLETEVYYKTMQNITEYEEGTNLLFNPTFESSLLQGKGLAYGVEVLLKKENSRLNGWVSYTWSKSDRQFQGLNNGNWFPAKYDRRHNLSVVGFYELSKRTTLSLVWEYISGSKFTPIIGQYTTLNPINLGFELHNIFASRNAVGLTDSHRLDLALTIKNKLFKRLRGEWQFSVYNTYNRATPISLIIVQNGDGSYKYQEQGLFGIIPSVSYNFKFK